MIHALWVERLGWTLIHFLWQGLLISAVYAAARRCFTRADHRYLLACAALAAMTAAPLVTFVDHPLPAGPLPVATHVADAAPSATSTAADILPASVPLSVSAWSEHFLPWIVVAWLAGAVAFWMRLMGGWVIAARMRSMFVRPAPPEWQRALDNLKTRIGLSHPVRLLVSALVQVPSVVGWLRPVVLVPIGALTGLPPEHIEALLLHELAHIRRRDYLVNMLQGVAESLLFYHPAVWWVSAHIRTGRELCCDDVAVSAGTCGVLTYARALAELESFRPAHFNTAMAANGGSLTHRIARLLGQSPATSRTLSGPGIALSAALLAITACAVFAQSAAPAPKFEVASIRLNKLGSAGGEGHTVEKIGYSPISLTMTNVTLSSSVKWAYGVRDFQISGAPGWFATERYDIAAKAPDPVSEDELKAMLQALLAERFRLALRIEKKELPIYALAVGKNGPRLHRAAGEGPGSMLPTGGGLAFQSVSMTDFAERLASRPLKVDRPVVDKTGLKGAWDFTLQFAENAAQLKTSLEGMEKGDPAGPSLFTVIQEQLGLRLEPTRGPAEMLVIDHVDRPTEN